MKPKCLALSIAVVITAVSPTLIASAAKASSPSLPATQICPPMSFAYDVNDSGTAAGYAGSYPNVRAVTCSSGNVLKYLDLPGDATESTAVAINNGGQVVGHTSTPSGTDAAIWDTNGAITRLGHLPGEAAPLRAQDINDSGWVVGVAVLPGGGGGTYRGFVWKGAGSIAALPLPSAMTDAWAEGINNDGQIVGSASAPRGAPSNQPVAVLWENGIPTTLTPLAAGAGAGAEDINGFGEIVGDSAVTAPPSSGRDAVVWDDGIPNDLGPGGGLFGLATAINASGQVVGYLSNAAFEVHAFLWDDGAMTALDPLPGDTQSIAIGINGTGKIVGMSQSSSGESHAVSWTQAADSTPPDLTVSVTPNVLWPPTHKYVTVTATVTATDSDPNPTIELVSVTSNEPDNGLGDGDTPSDIVIKPASAHSYPDTFQLRAERSGTGTGRIYTITYRATDASENSATAFVTVTVPLSQK